MALIDTLPGMRMPVSDVIPTLAQMWRPGDPAEAENPTEFHASKLNLILHFGLETTGQEALEIFQTAIQFSINHPSRIIVLCPVETHRGEEILEGKLFSQCFLGPGKRNVSCCDALILGYPTAESGFLENQVSIWLESDLPTYHWFHRVPVRAIRESYLSFVESFRRVVFDTSIEKDSYKQINWPALVCPSDLAYARTLPFRQSIGQFLSRFEPKLLVDGLQIVKVSYTPSFDGEAAGLLCWQDACLKSCGFPEANMRDRKEESFQMKPVDEEKEGAILLRIDWNYLDGEKYFSWKIPKSENTASIEADFGLGRHSIHSPLNLLDPEKALAEALFF